MSQQKVDRYREEKKNRKVQIAKEKKRKKISRAAGIGLISAAALALIAGIVITFVNINLKKKADIASYYTTSDFVLADLVNIQGDK